MRINEARGLTLKAYSRPYLTVFQQAYSKGGTAGVNVIPPKTNSSQRPYVLPESLCDAVDQYIKKEGIVEQESFLFSSKGSKGKAPIGEMTLRRRLKACLSSAGLPSFSFHRFRHSDASLLFALGVDPDDIALYLGHADSEITKRIYIHDTTERRKRIASLLDGLVKELRTLDQGSKTGSKA